jgi:hypothetical protein
VTNGSIRLLFSARRAFSAAGFFMRGEYLRSRCASCGPLTSPIWNLRRLDRHRVIGLSPSMKTASVRPALFTACVLAFLLLAGCGGSGSVAVTSGPGTGGAFSGTTISINPTLEFSFGGVVRYTNTESGSAFPAAASVIAGTYAYAPGSDFASGTLTLTLPDPVGTVVITLRNFRLQTDGAVAAFDAVYGGRTFTAAVQTGKLAAQPRNGGSSGGSDAAESAAAAIPSALQGSHSLQFQHGESGEGLAQYNGTTQTVVITATTLQIGSQTLTNPVFIGGNANSWIFKDGALWYSFFQGPDGGLSPIQVTGAGGTPFHGVFMPPGGGVFATDATAVLGSTLQLSTGYPSYLSSSGGTLAMSSVLNSGTLGTYSPSFAFENGSVGALNFAGSGGLVKVGSGTLNLSGFASTATISGYDVSGGNVIVSSSQASPFTLNGGSLTFATVLSSPVTVNGGTLFLNNGLLLNNTLSAPTGPTPTPEISLSATSLLPGALVTVATTSTTLLPGTYLSFTQPGVGGTISASSIQVAGTLNLGGTTVSNPLLLRNSDGQTYRVISTASLSSP